MSSENLSENPLVSIIAGSTSDKEVYEKAEKILKDNNIQYELKIISAHRNPYKFDQFRYFTFLSMQYFNILIQIKINSFKVIFRIWKEGLK